MRVLVANLKLDLIQIEREYIYRLLQEGRLTDEGRRRLERELDLEEASILSRRGEDVLPPLPAL
jgi:CPA1 family monovalent cation:H+ antiporter